MRNAKRSGFQYAVAAVCVLAALLTGCSRDPNVRKQKYLESGQRYFDKGQYREAAIQFENAIQVDSRFADAHYKLAQVVQDPDLSAKEYEKALTSDPDGRIGQQARKGLRRGPCASFVDVVLPHHRYPPTHTHRHHTAETG